MTNKEKKLVAKLLDMASDQFSNHGCNELEGDFFEGWTEEDKLQILQQAVELNCIGQDDYNEAKEEADEGGSFNWLLGDSTLMDIYARVLEKEAEE